MLRITKEKLYLGEIHIPREFLEKNLKLKFEADFVCVDEEKSFKIHNSNQGSLSKQEEKNVKFLLKNKDKIISDYQESIKEPEPDFEQLKSQKLSEAENYRKHLQFLPIKYQNAAFSTSEMARQNIMTSILILSGSTKKYWRDSENNSHEFNAKNFKEIATLISERDTKLYSIETEIKSAITKSKTISALISLKIADLWTKSEKNYRQSKKS
jgi:hypothetical protein